jgi:dihydrofolate synthase/folylpolyglutamate synthase
VNISIIHKNKFKSIHIGGTNGKGAQPTISPLCLSSLVRRLVSILPHLIDFRERIKIGNQMVSEEFVIDFVEKAKPLIEKIQPSFFELTVVMAFEYFAQEKVDIAMIEVGLGGRLDSTNVITPELCVITNVSFDHMNMLGNTIEEIAFEKAGIIKKVFRVLLVNPILAIMLYLKPKPANVKVNTVKYASECCKVKIL